MPPSLHHVVFAVSNERHESVAQMFTDLGFTLAPAELTELGVSVSLDWDRGVELISPIPGATAAVAASVQAFLDSNGDGIYTVVLQVPDAADAESVDSYAHAGNAGVFSDGTVQMPKPFERIGSRWGNATRQLDAQESLASPRSAAAVMSEGCVLSYISAVR